MFLNVMAVMCCRCFNDVLVMCWLCFGDALGMFLGGIGNDLVILST